jgi:hypothetical protein
MTWIGESSLDKYVYNRRIIMAMNKNVNKVYKSMQGKTIDLELLRQKNEMTPAVGNARVNARGDELGPGGKIIRKKEDILRDYYADNPATVPDESVGKIVADEPVAVAQESKPKTTRAQKKAAKVEEVVNEPTKAELAEFDDEWVEDDDGNFVQKGD